MNTPRLPWWQRLAQPSIVRRLVLAQMVLLLQLWGAIMWWMGLAGAPADALPGVFQGRGIAVPIVVSAMLLVIPAWMAVHVALRPWRRVNDEIAARGPGDLAPLAFEPAQQELRPLVQSINGLLARVRAGTERERQFIADAAHELRTPLAAMRVNVEALQNRVTDASSRELLAGMVHSGDRAARLVGQLLQLMRADAVDAACAWRAVALDDLANDCLASLSALARPRGIELQLEVTQSIELQGDVETLTSMVSNLVENAIKYSPERGTVVVAIERRDDHAVLSVTDEGPGIAPALRSRVFDRFHRGAGQAQDGSGLGLAIVKAAVERHRGTVSLGPGPSGPGLRVVVALPRAFDGAVSIGLSTSAERRPS